MRAILSSLLLLAALPAVGQRLPSLLVTADGILVQPAGFHPIGLDLLAAGGATDGMALTFDSGTSNWVPRTIQNGVAIDISGLATNLWSGTNVGFSYADGAAILTLLDGTITLSKWATNGLSEGAFPLYTGGVWTFGSYIPGGGTTNTVTADGSYVTNFASGSNVQLTVAGQNATVDLAASVTIPTATITNLSLVNPLPSLSISNDTPSRFAIFGADRRLTNDITATGSGAPVRATGPAFTDPTANTQTAGTSNSTLATTKFFWDNLPEDQDTTYIFNDGLTNAGSAVKLSIAAGSGISLSTNESTVTIASTVTGGSVYADSQSVTNFKSSDNVELTVAAGEATIDLSTNVSLAVLNVGELIITNKIPASYITNDLGDGWYGNGWLPLWAGRSNSLTGPLYFDEDDGRIIMNDPSSIANEWYRAWGVRAYGGKFDIGTFATNDFTFNESWINFDPSVATGGSNVITFGDSGYNNLVIFEPPVVINNELTINGTNVMEAIAGITGGSGASLSETNYWTAPQYFGTATATTPAVGDNSTNVATTGWAQRAFNTGSSRGRINRVYTDFNAGSTIGTAIYPFAGSAINSGSGSLASTAAVGLYNRFGLVTFITRSAATNTHTGYYLTTDSGSMYATNEMAWECEFAIVKTNGTIAYIGFTDSVSTSTDTDAICLSITNSVAYGTVLYNATATLTSTAFTIPHDTIVGAKCAISNGVCYFSISTNSVAAWSDQITTTLPGSPARSFGQGIRAWNTAAENTNGVTFVRVDSWFCEYPDPETGL